MFLRHIKRVLFNETRSPLLHRTMASSGSGGSTDELMEKWKLRLIEQKVPEVESSLNNIMAHVLNLQRLDELKKQKWILSDEQLKRFEELCECRLARMPVQYIIGEWDFREFTLTMRPPVFIPRPETEELVELVLQQIDAKRPMRFLEIGCGSGAISIALLKSLPKAVGVAIDQSEMACELTRNNASRHELDTRLTVYREKLVRDSMLDMIDGSLDLIVSNPPYVPNKYLTRLEPEIKLYEDLRALDGGIDGMNVIEFIILFAAKRLRLKGVLWLEVDPTHPDLIQKYLDEHPELQLKFMASYQDIFKKERFVEITKV